MRSAFGISLLFNTFLLWAKALGGGARAPEPGRPGGFAHSDILLPLGSLIDRRTKKTHPISPLERGANRIRGEGDFSREGVGKKKKKEKKRGKKKKTKGGKGKMKNPIENPKSFPRAAAVLH